MSLKKVCRDGAWGHDRVMRALTQWINRLVDL